MYKKFIFHDFDQQISFGTSLYIIKVAYDKWMVYTLNVSLSEHFGNINVAALRWTKSVSYGI